MNMSLVQRWLCKVALDELNNFDIPTAKHVRRIAVAMDFKGLAEEVDAASKAFPNVTWDDLLRWEEPRKEHPAIPRIGVELDAITKEWLVDILKNKDWSKTPVTDRQTGERKEVHRQVSATQMVVFADVLDLLEGAE